MSELFSLIDRPVVITGAAGLLGRQHAFAVAAFGGIPVLADIDAVALATLSTDLEAAGARFLPIQADLTEEAQVGLLCELVCAEFGGIWGLVNNVAANPQMSVASKVTTLETTTVVEWDSDIRSGLTSAWLCAKWIGQQMAKQGGGSIVNVASDLAIIAPDQRIYRQDASGPTAPKKPASYSAAKGGLRSLSRYLATYWSPIPVRSNCLMPGSVLGNQSPELVAELEYRIPLSRLALPHEYQGALVFLLSDASAYMTGAELVIDGGRSAW
jgi:NAD(P)-dependent dehydrogenase (short-subunit alcohol dehydrogenase family)